MKLFVAIFILSSLVAKISARKTCSIVLPKLEDFQRTWGASITAIDGPDYEKAVKVHNDDLALLGVNVKLINLFFDAFKALYKEVQINKRACDHDIKRLTEEVNEVIEAGENFLASQEGTDNFLTDPVKQNDPFLAEFYEAHKKWKAALQKIITDPEFSKEYFTQETANGYAAFDVILGKIAQRSKTN